MTNLNRTWINAGLAPIFGEAAPDAPIEPVFGWIIPAFGLDRLRRGD
ncbi:hypothetical protein [Sphingomonas elodea]|nr:hypothetical protein [Sphingomonas elodea]